MQKRYFAETCLILVTMVTLFYCCAVSAAEPTLQLRKDDRPMPHMEKEYIIGPGDLLEVTVWREQALSRTDLLVLPDGTIAMPLIDNVPAGGKTTTELKEYIQTALEKFVDAPRVYITVKKPDSHAFNILGNVTDPGRYTMVSPTTIMQGIAIAKGFNEWASKDNTVIIRGYGEDQIVIPFEYSEVISGEKVDQNIILRPGDTIVVP